MIGKSKDKKEVVKKENDKKEKIKCTECGGTGLDYRLPAEQGKPCPQCLYNNSK